MAKRLNGEGSLRRRADGRWEYRLMDGYLEDGRPNTVSFYGRTQKEVRDKLENYRIRHIYGIDTRVVNSVPRATLARTFSHGVTGFQPHRHGGQPRFGNSSIMISAHGIV